MLTYERIIKESQAFAEAHAQINSFGNGDLWELTERNNLQDFNYPRLFMVDGGVSINEKLLTYSFNVLALDQVLNGETNENFVKSSMLQLVLDWMAWFEQTKFTDSEGNKIIVNLTRSATADSFTERFDDILTGWNISVSITTPFLYNKCNIPTT